MSIDSAELPTREGTPPSGAMTRIALLALLTQRPMHGYEVRQVIEQYGMHQWANIQYSSIYGGLQQLTKEGLLAEAGTAREGNRPPRTQYRITPQGVDELHALLRQTWAHPVFPPDATNMALSFFMLLPPADLQALLGQRLAMLDERLARLDAREQWADNVSGQWKPPAVRAMVADIFAHQRYLLRAERGWAAHVLVRMQNGKYDHDRDLGPLPEANIQDSTDEMREQ